MHPIQLQLRRLLLFACVSEIATSVALLAAPTYVALALVGIEPAGSGVALGRCFGISLLALGVACWPARRGDAIASSAWNAMLAYNLLVALYLTWLGTFYGMHGLLLWPAVMLHAAVGVLLVRLRAGILTGHPAAPSSDSQRRAGTPIRRLHRRRSILRGRGRQGASRRAKTAVPWARRRTHEHWQRAGRRQR